MKRNRLDVTRSPDAHRRAPERAAAAGTFGGPPANAVPCRPPLESYWQAGYIDASARPLKYIIWGDKPPRRAIQLRTCGG